MGTTTAVAEEVKAIVLAGAGELLGADSPYDRGRRALRKEHGQVLAASVELKAINSQEDAEKATQFGRLLQVGVKETADYFKRIKLQIDDIKKPVLAAEKEDVGALENEKLRLGQMQTAWDAKVRREVEEANRIAREEALKAAREDQIARALEMEADGDVEQAEAVLEEPTVALPVVTQMQSPVKIEGKVSKVTYSARVTNLKALVQAVAAGKAPLEALCPNDSFIRAQARAYKDGFSMPGCELVREENTHYRG